MRINQPVTGVEHEIKDGEFVLSKTDLKGVITSVNKIFIEISGFAEDELIGQPHNLLRHPDMPAEAYEDMWKQLQAGRSWMGVVKNRCKNGDYYWAMANVSPIWENGQVTGYMSLRRRPERHEIDAVSGLYEKFRTGMAGNLVFDNGKIIKWSKWNGLKRAVTELGIKKRIVLLSAMMGGFMLLLSTVAIHGLMNSNAMIDEVYAKALRPAELADEIRNRLNANRSEVLLGMQHSPDHPLAQLHDHKVNKHVDAMSENSARVTQAWAELSKIEFDDGMASTARVNAALEAFKQARIKFGNDGILPAKSALKAEMYDNVGDMLIDSIEPNYKLLQESTNSLMAALKEYAGEVRQAAVNQFNFILYFSIAVALAAIGLGAFFSWLSIRAIIGPVERIAGQMREIRQGKLDKLIEIERQDEIGEMAEVFRSLLIRLGFDLENSRMQAIQSARINMALKEVASAVTVADEKANIIFVNDAAEILLGQISERKAAKGSPFYDLIGNQEMLDDIRQSEDSRTTADGQLKDQFVRINSSKVFDDAGHFVGHVTQWIDRTEEVAAQKRAEEAFRMSFALRNVETAVTVSDEANNLIFVNSVGSRLLQTLTGEADAVNRLIGRPVSEIVHDEALKTLLTKPLLAAEAAEGQINGRIIRLYSAPIHNAEGKLIGRLSQWADRTAEVASEHEIAQLVESVARGDFSQRMSEADREGFFQVIAKGLNQLSEVSEQGLTEVAGVLNALANGDLTQRIESDFEGMFAQLKDDANRTVDQLKGIVGTITEATETIHTAAREISSGNAELATRTESQSASLEETAASTEELNSTVRNNDDNAHQANDLARKASEVAARGGEVVQEVVQTMGAITESSNKISEIIGVIDGIAFQTNILALNAAVEAARAGEQGRGFAVVAGEVRSLAQRSAAAAKEIKELISESVAKVTAGHKLVEHAGETMSEVVDSIQRVSHIMNEITVSSAEQRNGIEQLNLAITSMDEATQQNVALVEEAAAAAQAMEDQAGNLKQAVSIFKVEAESNWDGRERRGPNRAANVQRMPSTRPATPKSAPPRAATQKVSGGEDVWEEF